MKINVFKRYFIIFSLCLLIFPSFSFAIPIDLKDFNLTSNDWLLAKSNCDSWYDYSTNTIFSVTGWQMVGNPTRIYGYSSNQSLCTGELNISNQSNGMYSLFSYNKIKNNWIKLSSSNLNLNQEINKSGGIYVLAKAIISDNKKSFGDFNIDKGEILYEQERLLAPSSTMNILGSFSLATSTATSTISWLKALSKRYQIATPNNQNTLAMLSLKIDNNKDLATTEIGPNENIVNYYIVDIPEENLGLATWYAYKKCDCAASRDFPKGTKLKVTNLFPGKNYGKSIVVKVNDYGPMEYTGNLIDLDKTAFKKIANLSSGIMPVSVEVVK